LPQTGLASTFASQKSWPRQGMWSTLLKIPLMMCMKTMHSLVADSHTVYAHVGGPKNFWYAGTPHLRMHTNVPASHVYPPRSTPLSRVLPRRIRLFYVKRYERTSVRTEIRRKRMGPLRSAFQGSWRSWQRHWSICPISDP